MKSSFIALLLLPLALLAQKSTIFNIDSLPTEGVVLNKDWKWHAGDNSDFSKIDFDDSNWESIDPTKPIHSLPQIRKEPIGWFRIKLHIDSSLLHQTLAFYVYQSIASEIYLDGKRLIQYGKVSQNKEEIKAVESLNDPIGLQFDKPEQVLAVRFSVQPNINYTNYNYKTFEFRVNNVGKAGLSVRPSDRFSVLHAVYIGLFMFLTIINFGFFLFHKNQKANLFFALATLSGAIAHAFYINATLSHDVSYRVHAGVVINLFFLTLYNLFLLIAVYHLFAHPRKTYFWFLVVYWLTSFLLWFTNFEMTRYWAFYIPFLLGMIESLRVAVISNRQKIKDARIIIIGLVSYLVCKIGFELFVRGYIANRHIGFGDSFQLGDALFHIGVLGMPLALSIYFFRQFAFTSRDLKNRLEQIEQFSIEKLRIAADMHDDIGSDLSALNLKAEMIRQKVKAGKQPMSEIDGLISFTSEIAKKVREVIWTVNARHDSLSSIINYFDTYADDFFEPTNIVVRTSLPSDISQTDINGESRKVLLMCFKESLNNVLKHAHANELKIVYAVENAIFSISIQDNGIGFDPSVLIVSNTNGNGLMNMQERMAGIGGQCRIQTSPQGTLVFFSLPF
jgi:signal transduction histidine kinase